nr:MAG TPA: tail protein [Caudoviricetes sp.]
MKKRVSKILWFGDALDENHQAIPPALSPSDEEHLQGLNIGEIYICVADADPALFIRTSADRIVYFKALDIEALSKFFIRKDRPDEAGFLIKFLGGLFSDYIQSMNFSSGALGEGFVIKVDSKTGKSYIEVDKLFVRIKAMFSELEIKKLSYAGGNYMFTAAGMKCGKVEEHEDFWRCYLLVDDGETAIENPFKEGDQVRFQDFNIKPGVYENVSNRYYWRLCVGVGEDYIDLSKTDCDANSDTPQEGDSLVQLGNRTDKKRQNAITLSVYGDDAPSIHQYAGIDSYSMAGKEVTVISPNPQGNKFMGDFILKTGINIMTQFKILEDLIYSEISKVLDEIQAEDNYLYNSAFASNTNGWEAKNDIHFFTVNGKFLLVNGEFYSRKDAMAAVVRYGDRNVLRILSSGIKQLNADLANKPTYEEGEEPKKFFISFRYKVVTAGTLTIGFPGQNLHFTEHLEPGEEYVMKEYSGTWDGTGDFELKFTGDIYIHSLALTDNAYEDMITKFETQLSQTNEKIEAVAERTSNLESKSAGWLTTADGVDIWAAAEFENGVKASSLFNVSVDEILLKSEHIRLEGSVSANGNVFINPDGTLKAINMVAENGDFSGEINADKGFIGDFSISDGNIVISSGYNAMRMVLGNEGISYQRINPQISAILGLQKEGILDTEKYTTISLKGYTSDFCGLKIHSGNLYGGIGIYLDEAPAILNNSALILNGFCPLILNSNTISAGGTYNCSWCMNQGGGTYNFYLPSSSEGRFGQMGSTIFVQNTNGDAWINTKNGETLRTLNGSSTTRWAFKNQFRLAIFHKMNYSTWTVNITE